jgi:hypothetical protein
MSDAQAVEFACLHLPVVKFLPDRQAAFEQLECRAGLALLVQQHPERMHVRRQPTTASGGSRMGAAKRRQVRSDAATRSQVVGVTSGDAG